MKAIQICEYGGTGTFKLEEVPSISITNDPVLVRIHDAGVPGWKSQARLPEAVAPPTVRQARWKMKSPLIRN
jgi:NADPH:quinone reductase-like Zn-dependent oxidoreductase